MGCPRLCGQGQPGALNFAMGPRRPFNPRDPAPRAVRPWTVFDQVVQAAPQPIELPHEQGVAVAKRLQTGHKSVPVIGTPDVGEG